MEFMVRSSIILLFTSLLVIPVTGTHAAEPAPFEDKSLIKAFVDEMVAEYKYDKEILTSLFEKARLHQSIIDAISRPAESKPWYQYRKIFVTRERVRGGVLFWNEHEETIKKVAEKYQVRPEIIVAIIGVETRYGKHKGSYPVLDSLSTLAFAYPPRAKFFRSELKHYLLMTREEDLDPLEQKGSYAGAMGMPQFISSSFRNYAVDFDDDGKRDLWSNPGDALASVGNYFKRHGWTAGVPVAHKVEVNGIKYKELLSKSLKPNYTQDELMLAGVTLPNGIPTDIKGTLIELDSGDGPEHWVVWKNFYVISRYNHSALYSMAVFQLSQDILESR
jgi:membrane-bound lytic murein transglycosylase B